MPWLKSFFISGLTCVPPMLFGCGSNSGSPASPGSNAATSVGGTSTSNGGNGGNGGSGAGFQLGTGGSTSASSSDCSGTNPPVSCTMQAPPGCGDGQVNQPSELCDDGNTLAGDGCSGTCQVEPNHVCPKTGGLCTVSYTCGDGVVNPGEVCDQGPFKSSPGCSSDCKTQEPGYKCVPGEQCVTLYVCGNARIESGETCDPPNPGNGCAATCQAESGWRCKPSSCSRLPYCGDGIVQADMGEKCDQGQSQDSPGCSTDCKTMDASCSCSPGKACVCQTPVCGDGKVQLGEQCDDGKSSYPGCSATCQLEPGYECPFAGAPCVPACGDGILVSPAEQCDPGMKIPNIAEACASDCSVKSGWVCDNTSCRQTSCGDGKVEGTEGCDSTPANNDLGDGCTPLCTAEPTCPAGGGSCTTQCGDGLVLGNEQCDDANAVSGDGCSSTCQVEPGFICSQPALGDTMVVPMVVRDFDAGADFEKGSSFAKDLNYANQGLVKDTLDARGLKPVLASPTGTYNGAAGRDSGIASATSLAQWYDDAVTGPNAYHATLASSLTLYLNDAGTAYVNRYGSNGQQYLTTESGIWCGTVADSVLDDNGDPIPCSFKYSETNCDAEIAKGYPQIECALSSDGLTWVGTFVLEAFDGNPLWYPADSLTPYSPSVLGRVTANYDPNWPMDPKGVEHNFSFTTEVRFWFKYDSARTYKLTFVGDDDVWVFINKKLAVDLGGIHTAVQGDLTFGGNAATTANVTPTNVSPTPAPTTSNPNLGLQNGNVYEITVFHAERQSDGSSYQLSLSGFNAARSECKPVCGGTNPAVSPGEQCDNGAAGNCDASATDCYNQCTTSCDLGPRCGDAVVQSAHEPCDNGTNTDGYAAGSSNACSPGCTLPPYCGDGAVQLEYGEECDNAAANSDTTYGQCTTKCQLGPYCGDTIVNGDASHPEACDDGVNDGTYGTCGASCALPPRCGDGVVQADWGEQCEPTSSDDPNCTRDCRQPGYCGDGVLDKAAGEQCDYGTAMNTGDYGGCNANCTVSPYCGDGVTNGPEQCDFGTAENLGEYGGCASTCQLGPHCGDRIVNGPEECDDGSGSTGNGSTTSRCTTACKNYVPITN